MLLCHFGSSYRARECMRMDEMIGSACSSRTETLLYDQSGTHGLLGHARQAIALTGRTSALCGNGITRMHWNISLWQDNSSLTGLHYYSAKSVFQTPSRPQMGSQSQYFCLPVQKGWCKGFATTKREDFNISNSSRGYQRQLRCGDSGCRCVSSGFVFIAKHSS